MGANGIVEDVLLRSGIATQKSYTPFFGRHDLFVDNVLQYSKVSVSVEDVCSSNIADFKIDRVEKGDSAAIDRLEDVEEEEIEKYVKSVLFHFTNKNNGTTLFQFARDAATTRFYTTEEGSTVSEADDYDIEAKLHKSASDVRHNKSLLYFAALVFIEYNKKYKLNLLEVMANYYESNCNIEPGALFLRDVHQTDADGRNYISFVSQAMKYKHSAKLVEDIFQNKDHELFKNFQNIQRVNNFLGIPMNYVELSGLTGIVLDMQVTNIDLPNNEVVLEFYRSVLDNPVKAITKIPKTQLLNDRFNEVLNTESLIAEAVSTKSFDFTATQTLLDINRVLSFFSLTDKVEVVDNIYYNSDSGVPEIISIGRVKFLLTQSMNLVIITSLAFIDYYDFKKVKALMGGTPLDRSKCKRA